MTTVETTLLIIVGSLLSIFIILCIAVAAMAVKLISSVRRVVTKAEGVVDSVENAADVLKDAHGRMALFKLVRNIIKVVQRSRK